MAASCPLSPTARPACGPSPANTSAFCPVPSWRCRSSSWLRRSRIDWMTGEIFAATPEIAMAASHLQQGIEHLLHHRHHAGIRAVDVLQRDEAGHLAVDVDRGGVVEALLQRVDHQILALLEVA